MNSHRRRMVARNGIRQNQCERSAGYSRRLPELGRTTAQRLQFDSLVLSVVRFHFARGPRGVPPRVPCIEDHRTRAKTGVRCGRFLDSAPGHHPSFSDDPKTAHKSLYIKDLARKSGSSGVAESQDVPFLRVPNGVPRLLFNLSLVFGYTMGQLNELQIKAAQPRDKLSQHRLAGCEQRLDEAADVFV